MQLRDATIVFDLDGTLVDTAPDLAAATNHALAAAGLEPMAVAELRPFIGYGSRVMLAAGLRHHHRSLSDRELDGLHERFFAFYANHVAVSSRPYAGVRELLESLHQAGGRLERAVMVGDSEVDIATAKAAKVPSIAVSFGYTPRPVRDFAPDVVIDDYREFMGALTKVLPAA